VPKPNSASAALDLRQQIVTAHATMIRAHYFDESAWLARLDSTPDVCGTTDARENLWRVRSLAHELGFLLVAAWIDEYLDVD
jgi:hypothetical protein